MSRRRPLHELKVRTCRTFHRCCVCLADIKCDDRYHDGGWPRRAHVACAEAARRNPKLEHSRDQLDQIDRAAAAQALPQPAVPFLPVPVIVDGFLDSFLDGDDS